MIDVSKLLEDMREISKILGLPQASSGKIDEIDVSGIDFVDMESNNSSLCGNLQKIRDTYMSHTTPIHIKYANRTDITDEAYEKTLLTQFRHAILSNNIVDRLDSCENDIKSIYNSYAKYIMKTPKMQTKYGKTLVTVFNLLEQLERSRSVSQKKLRSIRKESQIKECPECKNKMTLHIDSGKYQCGNCKLRMTAFGIVPSDVYLDYTATNKSSGNYRQEDNCEIWLLKLQGLESKKIPKSIIKGLQRKIKEEQASDIPCRRIRQWLKDSDIGKTSFNNHIPKIKFILSGVAPERLSDTEAQATKRYFKPVMDQYNMVKSPDRKNSLYQPYVILKILEQVVDRSTEEKERRFLRIVSNIHFQDRETIRRNDDIMSKIDVGLTFTSTDVEYYIANA